MVPSAHLAMARVGTLSQILYQPPRLEKGSIVGRTLFESPEIFILLIVLVGFVAMYSLRQAGRDRSATGSAALGVVVAAAVYLVSMFVVTPREIVRDLSRELVASVASADVKRLGELLRDDLIVSPGQSRAPVPEMGKEATISAVGARFGDTTGTSLHAARVDASAAHAGRVTAHVFVTGSSAEFGSGRSWWEVQWVNADGRWQVRSITPLWFLGM